MTHRKAIAAECRRCLNTQAFKGCASEKCKLNDYYFLGENGKLLAIGETPKQAKFNLVKGRR
mgnify:CR=1 FL=1